MLYQIAIDTLSIVGSIAYDRETRRKLVEDILNQQDRTIIDYDKEVDTK